MAVSRRRFFRQLLHPGGKPREERESRYGMIETYVRTQVLPTDLTLTPAQESELFTSLRSALEQTSDEEFFSVVVHFKAEEVVDQILRKWRDAPR